MWGKGPSPERGEQLGAGPAAGCTALGAADTALMRWVATVNRGHPGEAGNHIPLLSGFSSGRGSVRRCRHLDASTARGRSVCPSGRPGRLGPEDAQGAGNPAAAPLQRHAGAARPAFTRTSHVPATSGTAHSTDACFPVTFCGRRRNLMLSRCRLWPFHVQ